MRIVFNIINATICFADLVLVFLESSFVVRKYDDTYFIIPRPIKYYVYQEIGRKNINQYLANTAILAKVYNEKVISFCFVFLIMLYLFTITPLILLSVNFGAPGENLVTRTILICN